MLATLHLLARFTIIHKLTNLVTNVAIVEMSSNRLFKSVHAFGMRRILMVPSHQIRHCRIRQNNLEIVLVAFTNNIRASQALYNVLTSPDGIAMTASLFFCMIEIESN